MNERNKHKIIGQMDLPTVDPKTNDCIFSFFSTTHFLKTILVIRTSGTFGLPDTQAGASHNPKNHFLPEHAKVNKIVHYNGVKR